MSAFTGSHLDVLPAEELLEAGWVDLTQRLQDNMQRNTTKRSHGH
jgi:hypothetical protein